MSCIALSHTLAIHFSLLEIAQMTHATDVQCEIQSLGFGLLSLEEKSYHQFGHHHLTTSQSIVQVGLVHICHSKSSCVKSIQVSITATITFFDTW